MLLWNLVTQERSCSIKSAKCIKKEKKKKLCEQYNDKFLSFIRFGVMNSSCLDDFLLCEHLTIFWLNMF